jgi:hypothetical protein
MARGVGWDLPVRVSTGFLWYLVETRTDSAGASATILVDRATGEVMHIGVVPR